MEDSEVSRGPIAETLRPTNVLSQLLSQSNLCSEFEAQFSMAQCFFNWVRRIVDMALILFNERDIVHLAVSTATRRPI